MLKPTAALSKDIAGGAVSVRCTAAPTSILVYPLLALLQRSPRAQYEPLHPHLEGFSTPCPGSSGHIREMVLNRSYGKGAGEGAVAYQKLAVLQNPQCGLSKTKRET